MSRETIEKILNDPNSNPALKKVAQEKLALLNLVQKSAEGDNTATLLLRLGESLDRMQPIPMPVSGVSGISKEEVEKLVKEAKWHLSLLDWLNCKNQ